MANTITGVVPVGNGGSIEEAENVQPGLLKMPLWVWLVLAGAAFWLWKKGK